MVHRAKTPRKESAGHSYVIYLFCFSFFDLASLYKDDLFFTKLMHKFFILIHLLHSSTCFEDYCAQLQEDNCINTASVIVNNFG